MNLIKNQFAGHFFKEISGLNYVCLNYCGLELNNPPLHHTAELLVDRDDYASLLYVITSFPNLSLIRTKKEYKTQFIQLRFPDQSAFALKLQVAVLRRGKRMLDAAAVLASGIPAEDGIRIPAGGYRFDYVFQQAMLSKQAMPAPFCESLKRLPGGARTEVFGHLVSRYRFVIHLLDDLFTYEPKYRRRIRRTLREDKANRRLFVAFRLAMVLYYKTVNLLTGAWKEIVVKPADTQAAPLHDQVRAFLLKKAAG